MRDGKRKAVMALKLLNFEVIAAGDSYNDTTMLAEADAGILFRPSEKVVRDFPQFPVTHTYDELRAAFSAAAARAARRRVSTSRSALLQRRQVAQQRRHRAFGIDAVVVAADAAVGIDQHEAVAVGDELAAVAAACPCERSATLSRKPSPISW